MAMKQTRFTMINGHQVEYASDDLLQEQRHNRRESKSQKSQIECDNLKKPGTSKDVKVPMKDKLS